MSEELEITPKPLRPQSLTILCIFSFIGSGLGAISNLFLYLFHDEVMVTLQSESGVYQNLGFDMTMFANIKPLYFLLAGIVQSVAFTGVNQMWNLQKKGFHFYAIAQIVLLILSTIYIYRPSGMFPMFDLLFSGVFILMYFRFREAMH